MTLSQFFEVGRIYHRRTDIHGRFGGQRQGGISTPKGHPVVILFTGQSGEKYGYDDGWVGDVFALFGEGQRGDMEFRSGNKAIRDHRKNGKDLLLFSQIPRRKGYYRFEGVFSCVSYDTVKGRDKEKQWRKAIKFYLLPEHSPSADISEVLHDKASLLSDLRQQAYSAAKGPEEVRTGSRTQEYHLRSDAVATYVLRRAGGQCEGCEAQAPFVKKTGDPYLEAHHTTRLADSGPDSPDSVIALCPTCHRRVHYAMDGDEYNEALKAKTKQIEEALSCM